MWDNLLIILEFCAGGVVLGLFISWILVKTQKTLRVHQINSIKGERQTPATMTEGIDPSLEQPLNEADYAPDIQGETDTEKGEYDWLNNGVSEASASTIKREDDDWLNAGVEEVSTYVYKQQDYDWLNAENNQPLDALEPAAPNLKISFYPQDLARKSEGPFHMDLTTDDSSLAYQSLQDIIAVKSVEAPVNQTHPLMDEIYIKPVENQVTGSLALMDEIAVRPVENRVTGSHALVDEISIKPPPGPVNIEYELLDDLITKSAVYRTKKAKPYNDAIISNPVESPGELEEPVKTISVNEITEILNENRVFKPAVIPSVAAELQNTPAPVPVRVRKEMGGLSGRAYSLDKKAELRGAVIKALAALRIYNNNGFYIQDTNLTNVDALMQEPQIKDFTIKVLNTAAELDELIDGGYDLVMNFNKIKRGLKKGMVALLILVNRELASMGWACITEESRATFTGYPYNDDLDGQACIVGDWTNPKFRDSGISRYVKHKRQQLLKEKGFTFERSIVEDSTVKDPPSVTVQKRFDLTYKRRTYTNISLPGILGVEFWKERPLDETDTERSRQMINLLVLVLPSPPMVAALHIKPKVLKLNRK